MSPGRYQDPSVANYSSFYGQANGVVYFYSNTTIAAITDGTSNTMAQSECSMTAMDTLSPGDQVCWHWWVQGITATRCSVRFTPLTLSEGLEPRVAAAVEKSIPMLVLTRRRATIPVARTLRSATARFGSSRTQSKHCRSALRRAFLWATRQPEASGLRLSQMPFIRRCRRAMAAKSSALTPIEDRLKIASPCAM